MKWTKRFVERRREASPQERVSWPGLLFAVVVLAGVGFLYAYPRLSGTPLVERDFVGRVVDKSLTLSESEIGTRHRLRLLVRAADGRQFQVAVTPEHYGRARVGMWVTRTRGEIKLSWDEPERDSPTGGGKKVEAH